MEAVSTRAALPLRAGCWGISPSLSGSDWLAAERVLACETDRRGEASYLVKWRGLGYGEATWEAAAELRPEDQALVEAFEAREALQPPAIDPNGVDPEAVPAFLNGRELRGYQVESLKWLVNNMRHKRNCILGDEMGLGKTAQSISVLEYQRQLLGARGPFLVVAPLTTLGHWQREIETWTGMYTVLYSGQKEDRDAIRRWEFEFASKRSGNQVKFDVLLTSYELLLKDRTLFQAFGARWPKWQTVIYDEAHRLKGLRSRNRDVADKLKARWLLLLTGTPVQNNMREVFGLLSALDTRKWADEGEFLETYGGGSGPPSAQQIQALQAELRPVLLRRMKEDVETLPQKEEVVVWVELTQLQQAYYKALLTKQIGTLLAGAGSKQLPQMRNLAMELRKLCCHPYLCDGLEDNIASRQREAGGGELAEMVAASGKMVLLHKLLSKLRAEGRKVLIFSQFKIMLDVIEDSLALAELPFERIDGDTHQSRRQLAIDRFMAGGDDAFAFLLSTRAGGQGITLTAADTVVIYDSDWNPQNDLQAMARCHRIGQSREVTIYRLICKDTYEQQLFDAASLKYGLDGAILGGGGGGGNPEQDTARIEQLLLRGAHGLVGQAAEEAKAAEGEAFASEDIEQTLARRTERRTVGSRAGNTFSTATFAAEPGKEGSARDIWSAILPDEVAAFEAKKARGPSPLGKRKRSRINYADSPAARARRARREGEEGSTATGTDYHQEQSDTDADTEVEGEHTSGGRGRGGKRPSGEWSKAHVKRAQECLVTWGPGAFDDPRPQAGLEERPLEETLALLEALQPLARRAFTHQRTLAELQQEIRTCTRDLELQPDEDLRAELAEARRKLEQAQTAGLSLEGLAIPAPCLPAVQQLRDYWLSSGARHHPHIQERVTLSKLLREAASGSRKHAVVLGNACLRTRKGLGRSKHALPPGWGLAQDAALLHASHCHGLWPAGARAGVEQIWRDPACEAFCGRLEGAGAPDRAEVQRALQQPELAPVLAALRACFRVEEAPPKFEPLPDSQAFRKLNNTVLERLRALLTGLLEAYKEYRAGGCKSPLGQPRPLQPAPPLPPPRAAAAAAAANAGASRAHPLQPTLVRLGFQQPQQQQQQARAPQSLQTLVPQQQQQQQARALGAPGAAGAGGGSGGGGAAKQPSSLLRHLSPVKPPAPAQGQAAPGSGQQQQRQQQQQQQRRREGEVIDLSDSESEPGVAGERPARPSAQPGSAPPRQASKSPAAVGGMRTKPPAGSPGKKMRQQTLAFQRFKPQQ